VTHPTDPVAAMREACAKALRETADASGWKPADGAGPVETGIFFSRINALREGADLIETLPLPACATGDDAAHGEMVKRCPTCDLDDPALHPCDAGGCAHPCADDYHREASVKTCAEPGCASLGLTKARAWRCAIHHPEHPTPAPSRPADDAVARARERVTEAARKWMAADRAAKAPPFVHLGQKEWSALWWELNDAYDALLAAERAASDEKGG
jgi:hypothetical protein